MPNQEPRAYGSWLKSPLRSSIGSILLAGNLKNVQGIDRKSMRTLGNFALIFIQSGQGQYIDANDTSRPFGPGDAILIFPELAHAYGPDEDADWEQIYVVFNGPQFDFLRQHEILSSSDPVWHLEPIDYWRRQLESILWPSHLHKETKALQSIGKFVSLITAMKSSVSEARHASDEVWLSESLLLLSEPRNGSWLSPHEVAEKVGLSYENFRKLFSKLVGESPGQFQKRRRIERACSLIYQSDRTFKELAEEHGFCDVFHFSKVFSQVMGESPSSYRERVNGR